MALSIGKILSLSIDMITITCCISILVGKTVTNAFDIVIIANMQESQKLALAESTGLDQKQINNWFINQRKRHWKPSEDMQFVVMDATHPHYYMDSVMGNPFPMDCTPTLL